MPDITRTELQYDDYSWTAVPGDNPKKRVEDADRFSRLEGYEVMALINSFKNNEGGELKRRTQHVIEWLLHEKLPGEVQKRKAVQRWVVDHYPMLSKEYPGPINLPNLSKKT